jgi:hypothetical protein
VAIILKGSRIYGNFKIEKIDTEMKGLINLSLNIDTVKYNKWQKH